MNTLVSLTGFVLLGYFLGSLPFAVITAKSFGLADPRTFGSGNPGATNVLRSGNKAAALLTLIGDALKGWVAMWLARKLGADDLSVALSGIGAFIGHVFPVTLRFKGGKGVATALGVLAGFSGILALICAGVWLLVAVITRYSSLAALVAAISVPITTALLHVGNAALIANSVMAAILILRHRDNIKRLLAGTEGKLGAKKSG